MARAYVHFGENLDSASPILPLGYGRCLVAAHEKDLWSIDALVRNITRTCTVGEDDK